MKPLKGLDAAFLYLETEETPMHLAGFYILSPSEDGKVFDAAAFSAFVQSRLQVASIFRQKIVPAPLALAHPCWVEDENFDLENHLFHVAVPSPHTEAALRELAQKLYQKKLNRNRPLWEMYFIEGLQLTGFPPDSVGVLVKIHHAAIDGGSGAEILATFFDITPTPRPMPQDTWQPEKAPKGWQIAQQGLITSFWTKPLALNLFWWETLQKSWFTQLNAAQQQLNPPRPLMSAPKCIFNEKVSSSRVFDGISLALSDFKYIKNKLLGTTINDVVLAICAGALRNYLLERSALPNEPLVAMCPKSVRVPSEAGTLGNKVSAMLVSLATDQDNALQRLLTIHRNTQAAKVHSNALGIDELINLTPSGLTSALAHLYQYLKIAELHTPFCNLTITNMVGPPKTLYMNGMQMLRHYGLGPITHGMGLIVPVFSYDGQVLISAVSCPKMMPDVSHFLELIAEELTLLKTQLSKLEKIQDNERTND